MAFIIFEISIKYRDGVGGEHGLGDCFGEAFEEWTIIGVV